MSFMSFNNFFFFDDSDADSDVAYNEINETTLSPRKSKINSIVLVGLNEQLAEAKAEIVSLEAVLDTICGAAERIGGFQLRKMHDLREALQKSEDDALRHLLDELCERRLETICQFASHQDLSTALDKSEKEKITAIESAEAFESEVASLREELGEAKRIVHDERNLSRVVTMQAENMQNVLTLQHNELKTQAETIKDLHHVIRSLQDENTALLTKKLAVQEATKEYINQLGQQGADSEQKENRELDDNLSELRNRKA
ncbi:hypothetical protein F4804DRAFT_310714 [Jackrogersella minutella]|nr:hypothetical protein F4804DRAFT_310714 [Jackrogersella minutella]